MKKNFVVVGALAGTLIFTQSALAAGLAVTPSKNTLSVQSGEGVQTVEAVPAYLYQDNNYFMLRDLGKILGYRVDWNEAKKQASLTKESAAQDLQHLSAAKQAKAVKQSKQTILVGATEYENMNCLNIDGYNYFKLRDLVEIMDFTCGWDSEKNRIQLSTGEQNDEGVSISVKDFLVEGAKQKVIEEDVPYIPGTKDYAALGVKVIHVEDMAGMMNPKQVSDVIRAIRKEVGLPVHFHAHCIGGMADICYWEAIKAGACTVDCDVSALSLGPAHPPVESIVTCLKGTGFDPHLDMDLLTEINDYFMKLREKYKEFASKRTGVDISVLKHQIPGGMLSNLESQLKGMNAENRINEVFEEVHKVHKDFGYPPLATPFAQMVGAQATINVLTGQRYKMISNESKTYIRGMYGRPAGEIAPELKAAVLGNDKMITERPGSLIAPGWEKAKAEAAGFARTEEDVMTYALFPELAPAFLQKKYQ